MPVPCDGSWQGLALRAARPAGFLNPRPGAYSFFLSFPSPVMQPTWRCTPFSSRAPRTWPGHPWALRCTRSCLPGQAPGAAQPGCHKVPSHRGLLGCKRTIQGGCNSSQPVSQVILGRQWVLKPRPDASPPRCRTFGMRRRRLRGTQPYADHLVYAALMPPLCRPDGAAMGRPRAGRVCARRP